MLTSFRDSGRTVSFEPDDNLTLGRVRVHLEVLNRVHAHSEGCEQSTWRVLRKVLHRVHSYSKGPRKSARVLERVLLLAVDALGVRVAVPAPRRLHRRRLRLRVARARVL